MDAMALLCTLHADGPATLKNLRQAGCSSLEAVESMDEERLAKLLGGPTAIARRFAREAKQLRERLGQGILEREEPCAEIAAIAMTATAANAPVAVATSGAGEDAPRSNGDPLQEVLDAWRARDLADSPIETPADTSSAQDEEASPRPVRARPEFEFGAVLAAAVREITSAVGPRSQPGSGATSGLAPGQVDGLDESLCQALSAAGLESLDDLARADALALSSRLGLGYTRLWRLGRLAERTIATRPREVEASSAQSPWTSAPPAAAVREESMNAPSATAGMPKLSAADAVPGSEPSILELEWNLELRPSARPPSRTSPAITLPDAERENAGGPFV